MPTLQKLRAEVEGRHTDDSVRQVCFLLDGIQLGANGIKGGTVNAYSIEPSFSCTSVCP